jgi:hypothetical protein
LCRDDEGGDQGPECKIVRSETAGRLGRAGEHRAKTKKVAEYF